MISLQLNRITATAVSKSSNVRPSSAKHMSAKLFNVINSPSIVTSSPFSNAAVKVSKSSLLKFSAKQASIAIAHGSVSPSFTTLLLLFMHTNLESLSGPDGLLPSLPNEVTPTSPSSACGSSVAKALRPCCHVPIVFPLNPLRFTLILLHLIFFT